MMPAVGLTFEPVFYRVGLPRMLIHLACVRILFYGRKRVPGNRESFYGCPRFASEISWTGLIVG